MRQTLSVLTLRTNGRRITKSRLVCGALCHLSDATRTGWRSESTRTDTLRCRRLSLSRLVSPDTSSALGCEKKLMARGPGGSFVPGIHVSPHTLYAVVCP